MSNGPRPRLLGPADIPAAMRLKEAAGWNQTAQDWQNVIALAPEACFGVDMDGALRATATAVCFGTDLAWIGMVLTDPEFRGRGLARLLLEHALEFLSTRGVGWVKLDATEMGRPLYRSLGFHDEVAIERWRKRAGGAAGSGCGRPFHFDAALDREAFGADRTALIGVLSAMESDSFDDGYALGRPGSNATYFGPCVARSQAAAQELARRFIGRHPGEDVFWDILASNRDAVQLAENLGFVRERSLVRMGMRLGNAPALGNRDRLVFATAGFEYG